MMSDPRNDFDDRGYEDEMDAPSLDDRELPGWFSRLVGFDGEYDVVCEGCGRSLPCRYCAE
jgi:hypothetical protein